MSKLRELFHMLLHAVGFKTQLISSDTTTVGEIINTINASSVTYFIQAGVLTDGAYAMLLEEGDDSGLSDAAPVDDTDLIGTEVGAGFAATDDDKVTKLGYIGGKQFVRLSIVSTGTTTGGTIGATTVLGHQAHQPQSTQKV